MRKPQDSYAYWWTNESVDTNYARQKIQNMAEVLWEYHSYSVLLRTFEGGMKSDES